MPYASNDELPPSVANHLPDHAQDIFREGFNHARAAVKRSYRKAGDVWVPIGREW